MLHNHFGEFIASMKAYGHNRLWGASASDEIEKGDRQVADDFTRLGGDQTICFRVEDLDSTLSYPIVPDLVRLPFPYCWFEIGPEAVGPDNRRLIEAPDRSFAVWIREGVLEAEEGPLPIHEALILVRSKLSELVGKEDASLKGRMGWSVMGRLRVLQWFEEAVELDSADPLLPLPGWDERTSLSLVKLVGKLLSVMNCSNVELQENRQSALRVSKARKHGYPVFSTWTLRLKREKGPGSAREDLRGRERASPRLHLRRGHIRHYRASGKHVWVQPCMVGDPAAGGIHKDYKL